MRHLENVSLADFQSESDSYCLATIGEILRAVRRGETTLNIRTTYTKVAAIIRGCSGFAKITVKNPEFYRMGTASGDLSSTKGHDWILSIESKKL